MKTKHLLLILLLAILSSGAVQAQWIGLGSGVSAANHRVWGLSVADSNVVWGLSWDAVSNTKPDYLVKTTDGGESWEALPIEIPEEFYSIQIFALDELNGWLAAADELNPISGKVYKTTDGGVTWVEQSSGFTGFNETPAAVHFWNANEGVAFGATCNTQYNDQITIYTTDNGGDTWTKVTGAGIPAQLSGEGMCLYSGNGFYDVVGDHIWFVSSKNRVFRSSNRGLHWEVADATAGSGRITSIAFKNELEGIVVTAFPNGAARTTDGGATWTPLSIPNSTQAAQIEYIPGTEGSYVVHNAAITWVTTNNRMMATHDDGENWETITTNANLDCVEFLSPKTGFGGGVITSSTSGGMYKWAGPSLAGRIYVNNAATGANTGFNWTDAFTDLQDALAAAVEGDEIWVAAGTYTPAGPNGATAATFLIDKNIRLLGGFAGDETEADARDPEANPTILSGDLNGDDVADDFAVNRGDNVLHVITITNAVDNETLIDGFTVSGGHAGGVSAPATFGGGVYSEGTPTIRNCVFTRNFSLDLGGGLIFINTPEGEVAMVENCVFADNKGNAGGAVCLRFTSASFDDCSFVGNEAKDEGAAPFEQSGGAIQTRNANMTLNNCSFRDNTCNLVGGAFLFFVDANGEGFTLEVDSCIFEGNLSQDDGGAIYSNSWGKATAVYLTNSQFIDNQCQGLFGNVNIYNSQQGAYGSVLVDNCLFEGNSSPYASGAIDVGSSTGADTSEYAITNCTFSGNTAGTIGGALGLWSEVNTVASFLLENCRFEENQAGSEAGAIWVLNGSDAFEAVVSRCAFINNVGTTGAALSTNNGDLITPSNPTEAKLTMDNCLAAGNIGDNTVSLLNFPNSKIFNCTLADNLGGGLQLGDQNSLTLQNTMLHNPGYTEYTALTNDVTVTSLGGNLISDNSLDGWLNNTDQPSADPLLDGNYQLTQNSPAIDASIAYEGMPEVDLAGNDRLQGGCIDIGAYESPFDAGIACQVVGVREVLAANPTLELYPNPAASFLQVNLPEAGLQAFELEIYDARGTMVQRRLISNGAPLEVSDLPKGMYVVKAALEGVVYAGKFVRQ